MPQRHPRTLLSTDAGLTVLLLSLVLVLFVLYPFVELRGPGRVLVSVSVSVILVSGAFSLSDRRGLRIATAILAAAALLVRWLDHFLDSPAVTVTSLVATLAFLGLTIGGVLAKVLASGRITWHRLQGAIAVYLMLGLSWALLYSLVEIRNPGSFNVPSVEASVEEEGMDDFVYFSFVTLTTLGYGDMTPKGSEARTLTILEALVGQLFIGILIARLVSLQIAHSQEE